MDEKQKTSGASKNESESERRRFVLQIVQPGLAGLMDGSVSTLAPVFAAAFATHTSKDAFLVGMAASAGAGINSRRSLASHSRTGFSAHTLLGRRHLLTIRTPARQDEPRQFGCQPFRNKHRSGLVRRYRRAGRCR
jgi:hypothetical protein